MYISKICIKGYKSIAELDFPLKNGANIFVGKNGSGKTIIFEAVKKLILKGAPNPNEFPEHISMEISDDTNELREFLYGILQPQFPRAYHSLLSKEFLPSKKKEEKENFKILLIGKKEDSNRFHLKYNEIFIEGGSLFLDEGLLFKSPKSQSITNIKIEQAKGAVTLSRLVLNLTKTFPKISVGVDVVKELFNFLQSKLFFIEEMRDLQKENKKGTSKKVSDMAEDYQQYWKSTLVSSTFIDQLYELQNSTSLDNYNTIDLFKQICIEDGYDVSAIKKRPDNVVLRIFDKDKGVILNNTSFPSGILQKIFFNLVTALSENKILLLEEPENNLHPGLQKYVFHLLKKMRNQTLITTHSPEFVDYETFKNILKVYLDRTKKTNVKYYLDSSGRGDNFYKSKSFYFIDKRVFFSDYVILCEGGSEFVLLPKIFDETTKESSYLDKNNVTLIDIQSDKAVTLYKKILEEFRIAFFIVLDRKGREGQLGYSAKTRTYIYNAEDFDECYADEIKNNLRYNRKNNKKHFALQILCKCLDENKRVTDFLKEEAEDDFSKMAKAFQKEFNKLKEQEDETKTKTN